MKESPRSVLPRGAMGKQRRNGSTARRKDRLVHALQEGRALRCSKAVLVLVRNRLILIIMGSANGCPFDFAGLARDGLAFLRSIVLPQATVDGSWIMYRLPGVISSASAAAESTVAAEAAVPEITRYTLPG